MYVEINRHTAEVGKPLSEAELFARLAALTNPAFATTAVAAIKAGRSVELKHARFVQVEGG